MADLAPIATAIDELSGKSSCRFCGSTRLRKTLGPHPGGHYAKLECNQCDRFLRWLPKPKEGRAPDPRSEVPRDLAKSLSHGFCEMCKRPETELPVPQVLEGHHVVEVQDGGTSDPENIWVICTPCHRQIHHLRTYLGHYHRSTEELE